MTDRKRKLRFIQASLLLLGALIIFMTYGKKERKENDEIISKKTQERIELQIDKKNSDGDTFFNIEYSGIDLSGNRYILKSEEAKNVKNARGKEVANQDAKKRARKELEPPMEVSGCGRFRGPWLYIYI